MALSMTGSILPLLLLVGSIDYGRSVSLGQFEAVDMIALNSYPLAAGTSYEGMHLDVTYVNQTLFYSAFNKLGRVDEAYVFLGDLRHNVVTRLRPDKVPFSRDQETGMLFTLNGRVFTLVVQKLTARVAMKYLRVWTGETWNTPNSEAALPLIEPVAEAESYYIATNPPYDVVYLGAESSSADGPSRFEFFRIELVKESGQERVVVEHIAAFNGENGHRLSFVTMRNGMLYAYVRRGNNDTLEVALPIPDTPLEMKSDSAYMVAEPIPELAQARGIQLGRYVVFLSETATPGAVQSTYIDILDLETSEVTKTSVQFPEGYKALADPVGNRIFAVHFDHGVKYATLTP